VTARDEIQRVAAVLERPGAGYLERFARTRAGLNASSGEIGRQLGMFADRIADLTLDELRELHDETFGRMPLADVNSLIPRLARHRATVDDARDAVNALAPMLERLEADRNPFAYVVRALCCVLLMRTNHSKMEQSSL
jgi:nitrate reductase assembly molybdenum cofactor insertion protein NarJ